MMRLTLLLLPRTFAIYRLQPDAPVPAWASAGSLSSVTRTEDELSVVCEAQSSVDVPMEGPWHCFKVQGPLAWSLVGVLAALAQPLADANIPIFALSTFETDYLFVKVADAPRATEVLIGAGHEVLP